MDSIERSIQAIWQHRVLFSEFIFDPANPVLRDTLWTGRRAKSLLVVDGALADALPDLVGAILRYFSLHENALQLVCPPVVRQGGERAKNSWTNVAEIHALIDQHHLDRHSYVLGMGGGALLDLVGLAAATAHRGVRHVRIPTTTLSQCDSGVGVKNGINAYGKKNFIGTFAPPFAVINDLSLLSTLPNSEKRAGYSEAVKVACIRDRVFFEELERDAILLRHFDVAAMRRLIRRCAELHVEHIATSGDPFEFGSARPLDFGHWSAHKLEQLSDFKISHGLAVAIGIALDVAYCRRMGYLDSQVAERILHLLEDLGFELFTPELLLPEKRRQLKVMAGIEEFREHLGGELTLTMLRDVGNAFEVHEFDTERMVESIHELQRRHAGRRLTELMASV